MGLKYIIKKKVIQLANYTSRATEAIPLWNMMV